MVLSELMILLRLDWASETEVIFMHTFLRIIKVTGVGQKGQMAMGSRAA